MNDRRGVERTGGCFLQQCLSLLAHALLLVSHPAAMSLIYVQGSHVPAVGANRAIHLWVAGSVGRLKPLSNWQGDFGFAEA